LEELFVEVFLLSAFLQFLLICLVVLLDELEEAL